MPKGDEGIPLRRPSHRLIRLLAALYGVAALLLGPAPEAAATHARSADVVTILLAGGLLPADCASPGQDGAPDDGAVSRCGACILQLVAATPPPPMDLSAPFAVALAARPGCPAESLAGRCAALPPATGPPAPG